MGSHLLFELISRGERVRALKRPSSNILQVKQTFSYYTTDAEAFFSRIEWVDGDVLDHLSIEDALEGVSRVYHCAASVNFSPRNKKEMTRTNVDGTANMVNYCLGKENIRFCYVSSIAALGSSEKGEDIAEGHLWKAGDKRSTYSMSKIKSEMEVWRGMEEGLEAFIVNPSVIIGPGDWEKGSSAFFPLIKNGLKYYTDGNTGFVDVRDVVKVMVGLMNTTVKGERFVVSSENRSFKAFFESVAVSLNVGAPKKLATKNMLRFAVIAERLRSMITFSDPRITRDTIIGSTCQDFYENIKIRNLLGMEFIPVDQSIRDCATIYLKSLI